MFQSYPRLVEMMAEYLMSILRGARMSRRGDRFDRQFDAVILPTLNGAGFEYENTYQWTRRGSSGIDRILFNVTPQFFLVHLSFTPPYLEEIDEIYRENAVSPFIGYDHLLTPAGVFAWRRTSGKFRCKKAADRDRSLSRASRALIEHGFPWLSTIREPAVYASEVERDARMYFARVNEEAGNLDAAREVYERTYQITSGIVFSAASLSEIARFEGARDFVYVSRKLGRSDGFTAEIADWIDFDPAVTQLRDKNERENSLMD